MAWRRPVDKPLSEPMMVSFLTHICVNQPNELTHWDLVTSYGCRGSRSTLVQVYADDGSVPNQFMNHYWFIGPLSTNLIETWIKMTSLQNAQASAARFRDVWIHVFAYRTKMSDLILLIRIMGKPAYFRLIKTTVNDFNDAMTFHMHRAIDMAFIYVTRRHLWSISLTLFNFNPNMDK